MNLKGLNFGWQDRWTAAPKKEIRFLTRDSRYFLNPTSAKQDPWKYPKMPDFFFLDNFGKMPQVYADDKNASI